MGLSSGANRRSSGTSTSRRNILKLYGDAVYGGVGPVPDQHFGGNAARLKRTRPKGRVRELNRVGAELGREIADKAVGR